jgi:hypothetical protein
MDSEPGAEWASTIYSETLHWLNRYEARVREGRDLQPALEFGAFVIWSGILPLCSAYDGRGYPEINGALLRWKAQELQRSVRERWKAMDGNGRPLPHQVDSSQIEGINRRLDIIAAHVAKLLNQK